VIKQQLLDRYEKVFATSQATISSSLRAHTQEQAMNTTMLILAAVCFIVAVYAAGRRDAPTTAAGTVGAVLFAILAIALGSEKDDRYDC
jgi:hypothetical protein